MGLHTLSATPSPSLLQTGNQEIQNGRHHETYAGFCLPDCCFPGAVRRLRHWGWDTAACTWDTVWAMAWDMAWDTEWDMARCSAMACTTPWWEDTDSWAASACTAVDTTRGWTQLTDIHTDRNLTLHDTR